MDEEKYLPDTLLLEDRARRVLNCLAGCVDLDHDYIPYMVADFVSKPAYMRHTGWDYGSSTGRLVGAFQLARAGKVRGKRILLLDDVFTTGETVNQCARVLKAGGAREVVVLTLARTVAV